MGEVLEQEREELLLLLGQVLEQRGLDLPRLARQRPQQPAPLLALGAQRAADQLRQLLEQALLRVRPQTVQLRYSRMCLTSYR